MKRNHATDDKIRNKKLEYDINREEAKISALSSGKTDENLQTIAQTKFTYSRKRKSFEKQKKKK